MSDAPVCIDISHWQGFPDFDEVRAAGVRGMIHKATEGTSYIDPNRAENCANALKAGLAISTYMWIKPGDGRAQAEFYLSVIQPQQGERVVIDYEEEGCTLTTLCDAVQALLDYDADLKITVYSGNLLKETLGGDHDDFLAENTDLWLAQYTSGTPSWPVGTYPQWTLWQYSESGSVDGIDDGYVDLNRFYDDDDEAFLAWINPAGQVPVPPPPLPPMREKVLVAVVAPPGIDVSVTVNGIPSGNRRQRRRRLFKRGPDILR